MITLDTHAIVKDLVASGVPEKQAEVLVAKFVSKEQLGNLDEKVATKSDIAEVRSEIAEVKSELKADIAAVRSEIKEVRSELKTDMAILKTEFSFMKKLQFFIITLLLAPMVAQFLAMYFK